MDKIFQEILEILQLQKKKIIETDKVYDKDKYGKGMIAGLELAENIIRSEAYKNARLD